MGAGHDTRVAHEGTLSAIFLLLLWRRRFPGRSRHPCRCCRCRSLFLLGTALRYPPRIQEGVEKLLGACLCRAGQPFCTLGPSP